MNNNRKLSILLLIAIAFSLFICGCKYKSGITSSDISTVSQNESLGEASREEFIVGTGVRTPVDPKTLPEYSGVPFVVVDNNIPNFSEEELTKIGVEEYSELDSLGRCAFAFAVCGVETMPGADDKRGSISHIKPSGWVQAKYDFVDGGYLYNRCHLIGWQLSCENANKKNLITGTRYFNTEGMLPFENMIADYIKEGKNHVVYRVTPIFEGDNLVPSGVQLEAYSLEDGGEEICFNVYCYNVQPNVVIDYKTGESIQIK